MCGTNQEQGCFFVILTPGPNIPSVPKYLDSAQDNLLKGIDSKIVKKQKIESIQRVITYVLFSVAPFCEETKQVGIKFLCR